METKRILISHVNLFFDDPTGDAGSDKADIGLIVHYRDGSAWPTLGYYEVAKTLRRRDWDYRTEQLPYKKISFLDVIWTDIISKQAQRHQATVWNHPDSTEHDWNYIVVGWRQQLLDNYWREVFDSGWGESAGGGILHTLEAPPTLRRTRS